MKSISPVALQHQRKTAISPPYAYLFLERFERLEKTSLSPKLEPLALADLVGLLKLSLVVRRCAKRSWIMVNPTKLHEILGEQRYKFLRHEQIH